MLKVGTTAPAFEARLHSGELFRLADLLGRKHLVLYFYPKDFTYGCTKEACAFSDQHDELTGLGAMIIGVSRDSQESHVEFARTHRLAFPLISDPDLTLARTYDVVSAGRFFVKRVTYVIDSSGVIRGVFHHELFVANHWKETIELLRALNRTSV
jgi:thioredoxin-dependent peroxiredoxin